jgi:hypothetical protein
MLFFLDTRFNDPKLAFLDDKGFVVAKTFFTGTSYGAFCSVDLDCMEISGIGSLTRSIVLVVIGFFEEGVMLLA